MKVIREPQKFLPIEGDCWTCSASVLIESPEELVRYVDDRDFRDRTDSGRADCPCCGGYIYVSREKIPLRFYEKLKRVGP